MIKKLRKKLMIITIVSMISVVTVFILFLGFLNYRNMIQRADHVLSNISHQDEYIKTESNFPKGKEFDQIFESHYFTVTLNDDLSIVQTDLTRIRNIDQTQAEGYAIQIAQKDSEIGNISQYRYLLIQFDKQYKIFFLDMGKDIEMLLQFMQTALVICLLGIVMIGGLIYYFSNRILKPFIDNYHKQRQFITDAGHELKTPLTVIQADAEILEMDHGENEWISDIKIQTKRLTELTNDLITLSKMEEDSLKEMMIDFPISDIVEEICMSFESVARQRQKNFHYEITPMLSYVGEEKSIYRLVTILLDNAMKHSSKQGMIQCKLYPSGQQICLSVKNSVQGLQKEQVSHLFDRFYQVDSSREKKQGFGLGLSIAKAIVENHHGKIQANLVDENILEIKVNL